MTKRNPHRPVPPLPPAQKKLYQGIGQSGAFTLKNLARPFKDPEAGKTALFWTGAVGGAGAFLAVWVGSFLLK